MTIAEREKAIQKLRTALMFWSSFARNSRFNAHTRETIQITIETLKYVLGKVERKEIDMKLILKGDK